MIGMGTDTDMHGVYFQGNTIHLRGTHRDTLALFPHLSTTVFMQPDYAGKLGKWPNFYLQAYTLKVFPSRNWPNLDTSGCVERGTV